MKGFVFKLYEKSICGDQDHSALCESIICYFVEGKDRRKRKVSAIDQLPSYTFISFKSATLVSIL